MHNYGERPLSRTLSFVRGGHAGGLRRTRRVGETGVLGKGHLLVVCTARSRAARGIGRQWSAGNAGARARERGCAAARACKYTGRQVSSAVLVDLFCCDIRSLLTLESENNRDQDLGPLLLLLPDASSNVCEDLIVEVCAAMRGCMRGVCVTGEREDAQRVVVRVCVCVYNDYT